MRPKRESAVDAEGAAYLFIVDRINRFGEGVRHAHRKLRLRCGRRFSSWLAERRNRSLSQDIDSRRLPSSCQT